MSHSTTTSEGIRSIVERARTGVESVTDDAVNELVREVERELYDGATRDKKYDAVAKAASARIERDPTYDDIAADAFRQGYRRNVVGSHDDGRAYRETFVENVRRGVDADLLDERLLSYDLDGLADALRPGRDDLRSYMAMETLSQRYFLSPD
jgi:ribonucleoside-diphosphate reductase alpha chain